MKIFVGLAAFFSISIFCFAQPVGPVDVLYSESAQFGSNSGYALSWLRTDGSYVRVFEVRRFSGQPVVYSSGKTGTYTLSVSMVNPKLRDIGFDNSSGATLDFDTFREIGIGSFTWSARSTTDSLVNTSSRALVTPTHPAIAGFVIAGAKPRWVLIRGVGPALAGFGVADALASPGLALYIGAVKQSENSGWTSIPDLTAGLEAVFSMVGAFPLVRGSNDCATLQFLQPGAYTAQTLPGDNQATGSTLTEVYELPYQ